MTGMIHSILILIFISATTTMAHEKPKRIVFFGDSITEMGIQPGGYVTRIKQELDKKGTGQYEVIGSGISGNKVYDLYLRLEDDVLSKDPDIVVIYVGVNDVWHKTLLGTGTDPDKFERFYAAIIKKLLGRNIKPILCTPAVIGERTDNSNPQDGDLNYYSQMIRKLAAQFDTPLCDLRKAFLEYGSRVNPQNKESGILTRDRVHLNDKGNQLVADLLLEILR